MSWPRLQLLSLLLFVLLCPCRAQQAPLEDPSSAPQPPSTVIAMPMAAEPAIDTPRGASIDSKKKKGETDWGPVLWQSGFFLATQHAFRFATEPGTRELFGGPFFQDWGDSIRGLHGWGDKDPFIVNYIGHPMQGAVTSYVFTNNHRTGKKAVFGMNRDYWITRTKAMAYSAAYSAQFELGPLSEASLGNVGSRSVRGTMGWVDLVVTPTAGMGWQVVEDALDRYVIEKFENKVRWAPAQLIVRGFLNPARSFSNVMRLKVPWARDTRPGIFTKRTAP